MAERSALADRVAPWRSLLRGDPLQAALFACLHKACKDAVRWGPLSRNPLDADDPPKTKGAGTREMKTWSAERLGAFLT